MSAAVTALKQGVLRWSPAVREVPHGTFLVRKMRLVLLFKDSVN